MILMSDGEYITDGPLIDLAGQDWRDDNLPFELIHVQPSHLPDPEPQISDVQQLLPGSLPLELGVEARWSELDLANLFLSANLYTTPPCIPTHPLPL